MAISSARTIRLGIFRIPCIAFRTRSETEREIERKRERGKQYQNVLNKYTHLPLSLSLSVPLSCSLSLSIFPLYLRFLRPVYDVSLLMLWPNRMAPNILSALRLVIAATAQLWGISRLVLPSPSSSPFLLCVHLSTNCILVAINVPALALFYPSSLCACIDI